MRSNLAFCSAVSKYVAKSITSKPNKFPSQAREFFSHGDCFDSLKPDCQNLLKVYILFLPNADVLSPATVAILSSVMSVIWPNSRLLCEINDPRVRPPLLLSWPVQVYASGSFAPKSWRTSSYKSSIFLITYSTSSGPCARSDSVFLCSIYSLTLLHKLA